MPSVPAVRFAAARSPNLTRSEASGALHALPSTSFSFLAAHQPSCTRSNFEKSSLQICRAEPGGHGPLGRRERDRQRLERSLPNFDEVSSDEVNTFLDLRQDTSYQTELRNHYEIMFLIHENNFEEVPAVIEKVKGFVGDNRGIIWRLNDWGMRSLAYKIKKASKANYVLMNIEIGFNKINDLSKLLETDERVIRHMIFRQKVAITKDCEPPPILEQRTRFGSDSDEELEEDVEEDGEEEAQTQDLKLSSALV